ncbi:hypothetical protein K1719_024934 [Acacia pycnantha]|nr:hypothetical protein K1719_024934 [Acacia pycnantha]
MSRVWRVPKAMLHSIVLQQPYAQTFRIPFIPHSLIHSPFPSAITEDRTEVRTWRRDREHQEKAESICGRRETKSESHASLKFRTRN